MRSPFARHALEGVACNLLSISPTLISTRAWHKVYLAARAAWRLYLCAQIYNSEELDVNRPRDIEHSILPAYRIDAWHFIIGMREHVIAFWR